jgi:PadR family transcriptional regulator PadR
MRVTEPLVRVAAVLMADPRGQHYGYQTSKDAGVRSGVLYPLLSRMLDEGWLTDGWQHPEETVNGRPPRRYYELTDQGRAELACLLAAADTRQRFGRPALKPRWTTP